MSVNFILGRASLLSVCNEELTSRLFEEDPSQGLKEGQDDAVVMFDCSLYGWCCFQLALCHQSNQYAVFREL